MKQLLFLFPLIFSFGAHSQYEFVPVDTAIWTGRTLSICGPSCSYSNWTQVYTDTISPDTVINATTYKSYYKNTAGFNDEYYVSYRIDSAEKAIYFVPKDSTSEVLFYDYDAHALGDTALIHHYPYIETGEVSACNYKLYNIGNIDIGGTIYELLEYDLIFDALAMNSTCADYIQVSERNISGFGFPFTGRYTFETTHDNRCYSESGVNKWHYGGEVCPYEFYASTSSQVEMDNAIKVYPVPSKDFIAVQGFSEPATYFIHDQTGKLIETNALSSNEIINIQNLGVGIYFLSIQTSAGLEKTKFIKN